jgi:hypothetical protein
MACEEWPMLLAACLMVELQHRYRLFGNLLFEVLPFSLAQVGIE